jgi:two-component system sensor histidine kinase GlrK
MLMILFMGLYVTLKLNQLNALIYKVAAVDNATVKLGEGLLDSLFSQVGFEKKYLISHDSDFYNQHHDMRTAFQKGLGEIEALTASSKVKALLGEVKVLYDRYISLFEEELDVRERRLDYPKSGYMEEREKVVSAINAKVTGVIRTATASRDGSVFDTHRISYRVFRVTSVTAGLTLIVGILISFFTTRSIVKPISLLQEKTREIAKGRFHKISRVSSAPEIRGLAEDFNAMSERLKELDELKLDFISHISHELRTPLTSIKAASSILLDSPLGDVPEKRNELLKIIEGECDRLIRSVNRILDLSRMEAKMMDYHFEEASLGTVIEKVVRKLLPLAIQKKIRLGIKPVAGLVIRVDQERIGQVLENLLGNALKFTPERGEIVVSAGVKEEDGKSVEISVSDTGCGIPEENLGQIFERFKRIDMGRSTIRGTGLGLSIAKHIVADHGGRIWATSVPGKGSTFTFTLPVVS